MSDIVLPLAAIDRDHDAIAGAKMRRIADLARLGFGVPPGFVVTTAAFSRHIARHDIAGAFERYLAEVGETDLAGTRSAAAAIARAISEADVDPATAAAVSAAYDQLCGATGRSPVPTAVRSSATGEDGAAASFAGQYDSYLGMRGADAVLAAIKKVWTSLFSERALLYRKRHGQSHRETPIAVGVLELIPAKSAGIAFSVEPVGGRRDHILIEANWGLGESVVQGSISPDRVEIDKEDFRILNYRLGDKTRITEWDAATSRVAERPTSEAERTTPALNDDETLAIARAVADLERTVGHAVDVEWVIDQRRRLGGPATLVQFRHVTRVGEDRTPTWDPGQIASRFKRKPAAR